MGYHEDIHQIWKIWDLNEIIIKEAIFVTFDKTLSNKLSKELLKTFVDNSDQELDAESNTDLDFHNIKYFWQIQQPMSHLTSPLLLSSFSLLWSRSPISLKLPQSVLI